METSWCNQAAVSETYSHKLYENSAARQQFSQYHRSRQSHQATECGTPGDVLGFREYVVNTNRLLGVGSVGVSHTIMGNMKVESFAGVGVV